MKQLLLAMMLLISISLQSYGQASTNNYDPFELKNNPFHRIFIFDLGRQNKMQVETTEIGDLVYLMELDSIMNDFFHDMEKLADSLPPETLSRTIEYSIDGPTQKRISISHRGMEKSNFMVSHGEVTNLKYGQDSIVINGLVPRQVSNAGKKRLHYFRVSFFLNNFNELGALKGHLDEKINRLYSSYTGAWHSSGGKMHPKQQPDISSPGDHGHTGGNLFVAVRPSIDIQNYKNYFVPSFSTGLAIVVDKNLLHQEYCFGSEAHFTFRRINDKTEINKNVFIVASYGQGKINPDTKKVGILYPVISIGYLLWRRGDFFDKHCFKLGLAQFNLFGNYTKIEPTFYFHDFFKGLTPSLRITQHF